MKNIFICKNLLCTVFICFGFSVSILAQYGSSGTIDARSIGMGKTYNSTSNGIYSLGINPANLSLMNGSAVEFSTIIPLPYISFNSGSDIFSLNQFKYYFGGVNGKARVLTEEDKSNFNNLFSKGGFLFANVSTTLFSFAVNAGTDAGTFAISIRDFAGGKASIPQAIVELSLNGNQSGKKYNFDDQKFKSWWIRNYGLSYSRELLNEPTETLNKILAGVSFKLVHGFYYAGIEKVNTNLETGPMNEILGSSDLLGYSAFADGFGVKYDFDSTEHNSNFSLFMPPAGNGFGFDIGFSFLLSQNWNISLALTDIGSIKWSKNAAEFRSSGEIYVDDLTDAEQLDSLKDSFTGRSRSIDGFSTSLPSALRFGVGWMLDEETNFLPGTLLLGFDYNQGFNNLPGNSKIPRISVGFEWKAADWIPYIRSGISVGGVDEFAWSAGLGMYTGVIEFNFATSYFQTVLSPNSAKQISVAFGSRWRF